MIAATACYLRRLWDVRAVGPAGPAQPGRPAGSGGFRPGGPAGGPKTPIQVDIAQGPCVVSQGRPPLRRVQLGWVRRVGGSLRRFDETGAADRKRCQLDRQTASYKYETRDGVSASIEATRILFPCRNTAAWGLIIGMTKKLGFPR